MPGLSTHWRIALISSRLFNSRQAWPGPQPGWVFQGGQTGRWNWGLGGSIFTITTRSSIISYLVPNISLGLDILNSGDNKS